MPGSQLAEPNLGAERPIRTDVRVVAVRRRSYLTNTCSPHAEHRSLRSARSVPYAWPARSCARGRLRGRLGGRPGRARPRTASAPSGAARRVRPGRAGQVPARRAGVPARPSGAAAQPHRAACCERERTERVSAGARVAGSEHAASARSRASARPLTVAESQRLRRRAARGGPRVEKTGGVLLSQALAGQVPSALRGLTALFGMGRGVSPSPRPPEKGERPRLPVLQNCTAPHRVSLKKSVKPSTH